MRTSKTWTAWVALAYLISLWGGARELAAQGPRVKVLDVPLYGQKWNVWCWAASAQMVIDYLYQEEFQSYLEKTITSLDELQDIKTTDLPRTTQQCVIVNERYSTLVVRKKHGEARSVNCCADDLLALKAEDREICVGKGYPTSKVLGPFGVAATENTWRDPNGYALSFEAIVEEIDQGRPVVFSWEYSGGGRHVMVTVGYISTSESEQWVIIHNPWPPPAGEKLMIPYSLYSKGQWWGWHGLHLTSGAKENWRRGPWDLVEKKESSP